MADEYALHKAVRKGNITDVERLINMGYDVNKQHFKFGETPLHKTLLYSSDIISEEIVDSICAIIELLIKRGADINKPNMRGDTPLHDAIIYNSPDIVIELLIKRGADVNISDKYGYTPLLCEIGRHRLTNIVELLIKAGADINKPNRRGETPLHYAIRCNYPNIIGLIIKSGADINIPNRRGDMLKKYFSFHEKSTFLLICNVCQRQTTN